MISIPVRASATGEQVETLELDEATLGGEVKRGLIRDAILAHETNQHLGTSSTKTRSEVSGSNAKPHRQKGTGRARAGHKRSPIWRGGAVVHGPRPFTKRVRLNKKQRTRATESALLAKCLDEGVVLLDGLECPEIKTRQVADLLDRLELFDTVLIGVPAYDEKVYKSARNISGVEVRETRNMNAYDILVSKHLLLTKDAFLGLIERLKEKPEEEPEPAAEASTAQAEEAEAEGEAPVSEEATEEPAEETGEAEADAADSDAAEEPAEQAGEADSDAVEEPAEQAGEAEAEADSDAAEEPAEQAGEADADAADSDETETPEAEGESEKS
jgi:large subunit ribosomal protein L4